MAAFLVLQEDGDRVNLWQLRPTVASTGPLPSLFRFGPCARPAIPRKSEVLMSLKRLLLSVLALAVQVAPVHLRHPLVGLRREEVEQLTGERGGDDSAAALVAVIPNVSSNDS